MFEDVKDRTIVVIGATGDFGRAIAMRLAGGGARLALSGRDAGKVDALVNEAKAAGAGAAIGATVDVRRKADVAALFDQVKQAFGHADVMVYLPGLSVPGQIIDAGEADLDAMMDAGVKGAMFCAQQFAGVVDEQAGGLIINISSVAGKRANPNAPLYCTSKAAMNMFSEGLALQVVKNNIRVTTLSPGAAATAFWGERKVPKEKFLTVDEVAAVAEFVIRMPRRVVIHDVAFESFEFLKSK